MEQTLVFVILAVGIVNIVLTVAALIVFASGQGKMQRSIKELSNVLTALQKQIETGKNQGKVNEEFLSELKTAVSSAVANQMEYEMKQMKQKTEGREKKQEYEMQSTMVMPKIPEAKIGNVLCRSCYKPYPATEKRCPFCQARQGK